MKRLPFRPEIEEPIRSGQKTMTTRTRRYGRLGDTLDTPFGPVRLTGLLYRPLANVRDNFWRAEGVGSAEEFVETWVRLHPRKGFVPEQLVWLHEFKFLGEKP